jgi:ferredoxin-NADP reductase
MRSYGTVLLFAGGVGITHQISHVRDIVQAYSHGTCATRKVILIWSVRTIEQLEWVKLWLEEIIQMPKRGKSLKIAIHVTRSHQHDGDSAILKETGITEHIIFERVNIEKVIATEFHKRVGAMSVGVCGPGGLADDVRAATRDVMSFGNVDFWEESFTW